MELKLEGNEKIEGRFCHICLVNGDFVAINVGMQNSEITLDNLTLLGVESKNKKMEIIILKILRIKNLKFYQITKKRKLIIIIMIVRIIIKMILD